MTVAQIFDFKELTGKIFKLNDLPPRGAGKLFIPRSLRGRARMQMGRFSMQSGHLGGLNCGPSASGRDGSMSYSAIVMISSLAEDVKNEYLRVVSFQLLAFSS